jgi:hypothetical protein
MTAWAASQAWLPTRNIGTSGSVVYWTSTAAGEDSLIVKCESECLCDNTHATTDLTIYRATRAGVKLTGDYWKAPAGVACSDTAQAQCLTVALGPGLYIFDPDVGAVASAECRGIVYSP